MTISMVSASGEPAIILGSVTIQSGIFLASGCFIVASSGDIVQISGQMLQAESYKTLIDDYTYSGRTYVGKAPAGSAENVAAWQIKLIDETGNYTKILYSDGVTAFSGIWDNRSGYTYA